MDSKLEISNQLVDSAVYDDNTEGNSLEAIKLLDKSRLDLLTAYVNLAEKLIPSSVGLQVTDNKVSDVENLTSIASILYYCKPAMPSVSGFLAAKLESEIRVLKKKSYLSELKCELNVVQSNCKKLQQVRVNVAADADQTRQTFQERSEKTDARLIERALHSIDSYELDAQTETEHCREVMEKHLPSLEEIENLLSQLQSLQKDKESVNSKLKLYNNMPQDLKLGIAVIEEKKKYMKSLELKIASSSSDFGASSVN